MKEPARLPLESWLAILAGLLWLSVGASSGFWGALLSVAPGSLLLAGGVMSVALGGDERAPQLSAVGGLLGVLLAPLAFFAVDFGTGALLLGLSLMGFLAAGWTSRRFALVPEGVPDPAPTLGIAGKLAFDEVMLAASPLGRRAVFDDPESLWKEVEAAHSLFRERGWIENPSSYHVCPPPLEKVEFSNRSSRGLDFEHMRFESEYQPREEEPGSERWLSYSANRTAHAWILRHREGPRPWLVCTHGFGLGNPALDLPAFRSDILHKQLGLNLALPVLPLHGPRTAGRRSGDFFLSGAFLNTVHAVQQSMWDIRRLLTWIRASGAPAIGAMGLSLGGFSTSVLASLESQLVCAIAGIPVGKLGPLALRMDSPRKLRQLEACSGFCWEAVEDVLRVSSALAMTPQVPHERRYLFAGSLDRIVPPQEVHDLWRHWGEPRIAWYAGSHSSVVFEPEVREIISEALSASGLVVG